MAVSGTSSDDYIPYPTREQVFGKDSLYGRWGFGETVYRKSHRPIQVAYLWSWTEDDEVAVFIDNYGDVIRKKDLDFWKLDVYLDEDNCYQSHNKTEYCWGLWHILQSK